MSVKSWSAEEEDFVVGGPVELARPELGSGSGKGSPLRVRSQPHRVESPLALGRCLQFCTAQDRHLLLGGVAGPE